MSQLRLILQVGGVDSSLDFTGKAGDRSKQSLGGQELRPTNPHLKSEMWGTRLVIKEKLDVSHLALIPTETHSSPTTGLEWATPRDLVQELRTKEFLFG
jgi:hypothetical protein